MIDEKFKINCISCGSDKIQTTFEADSGYSNWTVMDCGFISFKCHGCGKFGTTDDYAKPNELSNFNIRCLKCDEENNWDYEIQDVDGEDDETHISCKKCGNNTIQETKQC